MFCFSDSTGSITFLKQLGVLMVLMSKYCAQETTRKHFTTESANTQYMRKSYVLTAI